MELSPAPVAPRRCPGCRVDGPRRHRPGHETTSGCALGRRRDGTRAGCGHLVRHALQRTDDTNRRQERSRTCRTGRTAGGNAGAKAATLPDTTPPAVAPTSNLVALFARRPRSARQSAAVRRAPRRAPGTDCRRIAAKNNARAGRERTAQDGSPGPSPQSRQRRTAACGLAGRRATAPDRHRAAACRRRLGRRAIRRPRHRPVPSARPRLPQPHPRRRRLRLPPIRRRPRRPHPANGKRRCSSPPPRRRRRPRVPRRPSRTEGNFARAAGFSERGDCRRPAQRPGQRAHSCRCPRQRHRRRHPGLAAAEGLRSRGAARAAALAIRTQCRGAVGRSRRGGQVPTRMKVQATSAARARG